MYDSIRPYKDDEVRAVLERLIRDGQLVDLLAKYRLPKVHQHLRWLSYFITFLFLQRRIRGINDVASFQKQITSNYIYHLINQTITKLETSGIEDIDKAKSYLYFSNHRDIILDSTLTCYCLYKAGHDTIRIAAGDNLESIPFCRDLLKLNKSFLVNRSESSPKKKYLALQELSSYILHSLTKEDQSVWIAQREGRAKDSLDCSDTSVLKMLHLSDRKLPLRDQIARLNLRPVAISYEYDPCDLLKAQERLQQKMDIDGTYQKQLGEDMHSVITGLQGFKGKVHIAFGKLIAKEHCDSIEQLANTIDDSIINSYHLYPSNYTALRMLAEQKKPLHRDYHKAWQWYQSQHHDLLSNDKRLIQRYLNADTQLQLYFLENYANPCLAKWRIANKLNTIS